MRVPSAYDARKRQAEPIMTPMIDVVFLLLIFFVWTASFQAIEFLLPSELTAESAGGAAVDLAEQDFEKIVVSMRTVPTGVQVILNGQSLVDLQDLRGRLNQLASVRADLPVVIDPDENVLIGDVIDVYDLARAVGLANIQFTTRVPTTDPG